MYLEYMQKPKWEVSVFPIRSFTNMKCSSAFWSVIHTEYVLWTYAGQMLTFKEGFWVLVLVFFPQEGFCLEVEFFRKSAQWFHL